VDAWTQGKRQIDPISERDSKPLIDAVSAQVLTTRTPAYGLTGGLYDALRDTHGRMYAVTNQEAEQASLLFEELEGIDISPAASVATASLMQAVEAGYIHKQDVVLLNITSGGRKRLHQDYPLHYLHPRLVLSPQSIVTDSIRRQMTQHLEESVEYSSL
jgi:cysteate synthase